jgi:WD40 repeat protein
MTALSIDAVEFTLQNTLRGHTQPINFLSISPDKTRLISIGAFSYFLINPPFIKELVGDDSRVIVWSVASGEKLFVAHRPFNGAATAASWASHDGSRFVVGFAGGDLSLFVSEGEKVIQCYMSSTQSDLHISSRIAIIPLYQRGQGLLRASYMMQSTTAWHAFAKNLPSCGR